MARKPARLERTGALTPRDRMWAAIRELSVRPFSAVEIAWLANLRAPADGQSHIDAVQSYLEGLSRAQPAYLDRSEDCGLRGELKTYVLVRDVGVDAPRVTKDGKPVTQGLGNELLWQAMKPLKEFDYVELVAAVAERAAAAGIVVSAETAKSYCTALERAGYLVLASAAVPGRGKKRARYRFVRSADTGPRAPLITKQKEVLDGNTNELKWKGEKACQDRT